jgi:hypothetical protein
MKKLVLAVPIVALALGGTTACATKKFVRGEVTQVNDKVDTLSRSVEENQERTRTNEGRIGEVSAPLPPRRVPRRRTGAPKRPTPPRIPRRRAPKPSRKRPSAWSTKSSSAKRKATSSSARP